MFVYVYDRVSGFFFKSLYVLIESDGIHDRSCRVYESCESNESPSCSNNYYTIFLFKSKSIVYNFTSRFNRK